MRKIIVPEIIPRLTTTRIYEGEMIIKGLVKLATIPYGGLQQVIAGERKWTEVNVRQTYNIRAITKGNRKWT